MDKTLFLFVPATRLDWVSKAKQSKANAIIIDLEDAVADDQKNHARTALMALDATKASAAIGCVSMPCIACIILMILLVCLSLIICLALCCQNAKINTKLKACITIFISLCLP